MTYYLKHYFEPGFDHTRLTPKEREDGSVDHQDLGYVQNVVVEQVLAEWVEVPAGEVSRHERKFLANEPRDVLGPGCRVNPDNPLQILAAENGYVYYLDDKIAVKSTMNVRRSVDYHTGNIAFVGDVIVHGSVRSGFQIRARTVRAKDVVEGATVSAMDGIVCEAGIKGSGQALVEAGRSIKASFCENATLKAGDNVVVDGACMHSKVFAGHKFAAKGRVTGGAVYCYEYAFIGGQLGGGIGAETQVMVGYDPILLYADQQINTQIANVKKTLEELSAQLGKNEEVDEELAPSIAVAKRRLGLLFDRKTRVWERISSTEILDSCRIMIQGKVHPGVEISIGPAWLRVGDYLEDVYFYLEDLEIKIGSPALKK